jgi:hypothetical protein
MIFDISLPIYQIMTAKNFTTHKEKGRIILIELNTLANCLPVKEETYSRIIHGLMASGFVTLCGQSERLRRTRQ